MIGDEAAAGEFWLSLISIEQPPMAADGSFEPALPGLIVRLDEVHAIVLALGMIEHLVHGATLIHRLGQSPFTHPPTALPTDFTHPHILASKIPTHPPADHIPLAAP